MRIPIGYITKPKYWNDSRIAQLTMVLNAVHSYVLDVPMCLINSLCVTLEGLVKSLGRATKRWLGTCLATEVRACGCFQNRAVGDPVA